MSNEFNLELAKKGNPIEFNWSEGLWQPAHFVGMSTEGYVVVQYQIPDSTQMTAAFCCDQSALRMGPKKLTWNCRIYIRNGEPVLSKGAYPIVWAVQPTDGYWHGEPFVIETEVIES